MKKKIANVCIFHAIFQFSSCSFTGGRPVWQLQPTYTITAAKQRCGLKGNEDQRN